MELLLMIYIESLGVLALLVMAGKIEIPPVFLALVISHSLLFVIVSVFLVDNVAGHIKTELLQIIITVLWLAISIVLPVYAVLFSLKFMEKMEYAIEEEELNAHIEEVKSAVKERDILPLLKYSSKDEDFE